jgi:hypothetical protein
LILRGLVLVAFTALGLGYAIKTPLWQNPDEPAHFNYVVQIASTGTLPELKQGDWDAALLERLKNGRLQPGDAIETIRYEGWQPPLYYLLAAPILRLSPPDAGVVRLRLFGVLLGLLTLVVALRAACFVLPPPLVLAVPATMAGIPMFTAVSASVSADPLANLLAAVMVLVMLSAVHSRVASRWAVSAGIVLGLGLVTKVALAIFAPLLLVLTLTRACRRLRTSLVLVAASTLVTLPWLIHQVTTYGWTDPLAISRHASVVADQPRFAGLTPEYMWSFLSVSVHSFWAQFGWMAVVAPDRLYWVWGALTVIAVAGLVGSRSRFQEARWQLVLATLVLALLAYIAYNLVFTQFQGRYLFTALVPISILLIGGWSGWLPSRWVRAVWAAPVVLIALNVYALTRVLVPGFAPVT